MRAKSAGVFVVGVLGLLVAASGFVAQGCGGGGGSSACTVASEGCPCTAGGLCDNGLECKSNLCVDLGGGGAGTGGGNAGTGGGQTAEQMCDAFAGYCAKLNECAPAIVKLNYGTVERCSARFAISCKDAVKAPDSGLTATTIAACMAALPGATCDDVIYRKVAACAIKGTRSNGMACGTNEQCTTGYCSQSANACGVCSAFVAAGATCTVTEDCQPGLECSVAGRCIVPGGAGMTCSETQTCRYGHFCEAGSCVLTAETAGETCNADLLSSCNVLKGRYCNGSGVCANIGFAENGDPCGLVAAKFVACSKGECIYPSTVAIEGVCKALAADGVTCNDTTSCELPAVCDAGGKCKLPSSAACL
jgi:hypothetical protein